MRIRFDWPGNPDPDWWEERDMQLIPRIGETIMFGPADEGDELTVHGIHHYPDDPDFQIYIVLRG